MNGPGDIPVTNGTSNRPCGLTSLIPTISMSCRGRAEAFARSLQSKLRTLGTQSADSPTGEDDPIIGLTDNTWVNHGTHGTQVTEIQPLRSTSIEADSFFDFDCELESPGSPAEECEYSRLIETASTTPHDCAPESGYICASPLSPDSNESSHSSSEGPFFDPESSEGEPRSLPTDYYDCDELKIDNGGNIILNGIRDNVSDILQNDSSESFSDSLPPSQESTSGNTPSATISSATFTGVTSPSNSTLQDMVLNDLQQLSREMNALPNGHHLEEDSHAVAAGHILEEDKSPLSNGHHMEEDINTETAENCKTEYNLNIEKEVPLTKGYYHSSSLEIPPHKPAAKTENESQDNPEQDADSKSASKKKHLSSSDTDDDDDCRPERVRRCSSLKTGKTPPGTPGRKKIVRFADVLGLDLADVKTFLDEVPTVPKSAYEDLEVIDSEPPIQLGPRVDKILMPLFQQPGGLASFLDVVREKQVCLENAAVTDTINMTITGCVRVRNLDFHKSVHIRYSIDNWKSFADLQANHVGNSCDGFSDKFTFILFGNSMTVGQRMEFAVRFQCKGQQFWDNNYGANYCFQCLPATVPAVRPAPLPDHSAMISPVDTWLGSFY